MPSTVRMEDQLLDSFSPWHLHIRYQLHQVLWRTRQCRTRCHRRLFLLLSRTSRFAQLSRLNTLRPYSFRHYLLNEPLRRLNNLLSRSRQRHPSLTRLAFFYNGDFMTGTDPTIVVASP